MTHFLIKTFLIKKKRVRNLGDANRNGIFLIGVANDGKTQLLRRLNNLPNL